ncbi:MAG: mechanosensitive ion channel [Candidatus Accumulibacter sp.]|jgi:small conductance mechanosensitive channel|nr:mechanosensitive ion channel [Accumulibacter sp.]
MEAHFQVLDHFKAQAVDMAMLFGPKLIVAALILFAGYLSARWAGRVTGRLLRRLKLEPPLRALLERVVQLLVFALFIIMAMQNLGVELLPLVAGLGVAGAGVALALQGVLSNVVAGLTIIFTQPFHVGDYISIGGEEGDVLDISLFNTTLGHFDRSRVVIPNRKIVGEILHNCGKIRRLSLSVAIACGADVNAALRLIDDVLKANPKVLETPAPVVGVVRLGEANIGIGIYPWVAVPDFESATGQINQAVAETFRANGIPPAIPQREVRMLEG